MVNSETETALHCCPGNMRCMRCIFSTVAVGRSNCWQLEVVWELELNLELELDLAEQNQLLGLRLQ